MTSPASLIHESDSCILRGIWPDKLPVVEVSSIKSLAVQMI